MFNLDTQQNKIKYALFFLAALVVILIIAIVIRSNSETDQNNGQELNKKAETVKEPTQEELLKSISVPESDSEGREVPADVLNSLSVPVKTEETVAPPVDQKVIDSLSAPTK